MRRRQVFEPILPEPGSFDARSMARGEPGVPRRFTWRSQRFEVAAIEARWKELSAAAASGGDRYVRRHAFRVRTTGGQSMRLVAERGSRRGVLRWWIRTVEEEAP